MFGVKLYTPCFWSSHVLHVSFFFNLGLVSSLSWKPKGLKEKLSKLCPADLKTWAESVPLELIPVQVRGWFFVQFFSWSLSQFGLFISVIWYFKFGEVFPLFVLIFCWNSP